VGEHKDNIVDGFTQKRGVHTKGCNGGIAFLSSKKNVVEAGVDFLKVTARKPSSRFSPD